MDYANRLDTAENVNRFIYGGQGICTLLQVDNGVYHSYKFARPKDKSFPPDVTFVYAVHYTETDVPTLFYIGMVDRDGFRITSKSRFRPDNDIVKGAKWIVKMSKSDKIASDSRMILTHDGRCARCGRPLSREEACRTGIGKKCMKYVERRLLSISTLM